MKEHRGKYRKTLSSKFRGNGSLLEQCNLVELTQEEAENPSKTVTEEN
jgi:hypothetical protein